MSRFLFDQKKCGIFTGIILLGLFISQYSIRHQTGYGAIHVVNQSIPPGFQFTQQETIPETLRLPSDYQKIREQGGLGIPRHEILCQDSGQRARIIEYYNNTGGYQVVGGWSFRYAALCGNAYVIADSSDGAGWGLYGPFLLQK